MLNIKQQQEHLDDKIESHESEIRIFKKLKMRLERAVDNPDALIVHAYDSNHPEAIYIGDKVMTKYGNEGVIVDLNHIKKTFSIKISSEWEKDRIGTIEEFDGSRLSFIMELAQ